MNEVESHEKKASQNTFAAMKVKRAPEDAMALNLDIVSANTYKVYYGIAARTALQRFKSS